MGTTLAIRFPLGRYHANPWDRAVNEGSSEWPPSPWRLLRALTATWYTRWPDLPVSVLDGLLDHLGDPPAYRTPATRPGHTRHYLPNLHYKRGLSDAKKQRPKALENDPSGKELTFDPFLLVPRDSELLVRWKVDLAGEQRQALAKLAVLLPYLGRAESVCEARLLDSDWLPDESWWHAGSGNGSEGTRLLTPTRPVSRVALEASTVDIRRSRKTMPPGTMWVSYTGPAAQQPRSETRESNPAKRPTAVRFAVTGNVPMRMTQGVLLADEAHRQVGQALTRAGREDAARKKILGSNGAATDHGHAHWIPLPGSDGAIEYFVIWVPDGGLQADEIAAVVTLSQMSGRRGGGRDAGGYDLRGFPKVRLLFQAAGPVEQVAPELCGPARSWRSLTPYLPVRHRKREMLEEFLTADVHTELRYRPRYRQTAPPQVFPLHPGPVLTDRWALGFRRYRTTEDMSKSRPGLALRLEFPEPVYGPLLLGQLSHFGYGIFFPEPR
jgi:CRISPR-associated protein Csb2